MRITYIFFVLLCFVLISCGENQRNTASIDTIADTQDALASSDTLPREIIASRLGGDTITPENKSLIFFTFSKALSENNNKPLTAKEVRKRFYPMDPECDDEAQWTFQRFFYIDSLHAIGEEPDDDMGQTVEVVIREFEAIKQTPEESWVVWTMHYKTAEMCPFASGTYYMLSTYDAKGKHVSTQCMGRDVGGADPPVSWSASHESNIFTDGSFRGVMADTSGDMEAPEDLSIVRKTYTGMISPGGKITTEVKEIERNQ